jgi:hypothetical protein
MSDSTGAAPLSTLLIETNWRQIAWPELPAPYPPRISLDGIALTPYSPAATPAGWQLVVLDTEGGPARVVFNQYFTLQAQQGWYNNYKLMYQSMYNALTGLGYTTPRYVLVLASFAIDNNMLPTPPLFDFLLNAGAGERLFYWQEHSDPGSQVGNPTSWISYDGIYILVGRAGAGEGTGTEVYSNQTSASLKVVLGAGSLTVVSDAQPA